MVISTFSLMKTDMLICRVSCCRVLFVDNVNKYCDRLSVSPLCISQVLLLTAHKFIEY